MLNFQPPVEPSAAAEGAKGGFNAGETIIEHVSNTSVNEPIIHLPRVFGIDMSVTKHVLMLWIVAAILFFGITWLVRRFIRQERPIPSRPMSALEIAIEFVRDGIVEPNVGHRWSRTWTPLVLTLFLFILVGNLMGVIPVFDVLELANSAFIHASPIPCSPHAAWRRHGDGELQRHRGAGDDCILRHHRRRNARARLHPALEESGAVGHAGLRVSDPGADRDHGHVRAAVRADDATCGEYDGRTHRDPRAAVIDLHLHAAVPHALAGIGIGMVLSLPIGVGLTALELIVILVQAYVFALLTAVFIGMAIHAHH
jgi:F-type H+-transporting ATPase subunit a